MMDKNDYRDGYRDGFKDGRNSKDSDLIPDPFGPYPGIPKDPIPTWPFYPRIPENPVPTWPERRRPDRERWYHCM